VKRKDADSEIQPGTEPSYVRVVFEEFQHKLDLVVECIQSLRQEMKQDMAAMEERLMGEIMLNRVAIKHLSERVGRLEIRMEKLEIRMEKLEGRTDNVVRLLEIHDADIANLKKMAS
jgi:hypothetical protein